jgi:hypothetical protein
VAVVTRFFVAAVAWLLGAGVEQFLVVVVVVVVVVVRLFFLLAIFLPVTLLEFISLPLAASEKSNFTQITQ